MLDRGGEAAEERIAFISELPRLLHTLASGDSDGDGDPDLPRVRSLHVGVVSTELGTGDVSFEPCTAGPGDDGILQAEGSGTAPCVPAYPSSVFAFDVEGPGDVDALSTDVSCVANALRSGGCGLQPLETLLKAVSPAPLPDGRSSVAWTGAGYVPVVFGEGSFGQAGPDGRNAGFIREGSVLAIVLVTMREDCSTPNPAIWDRSDPRYPADAGGLRCFTYADELYPVERYVDGLSGLRRDAGDLVFAAIVGVPPSPSVPDGDYAALLSLPEMTETVNATRSGLVPSCAGPLGRGVSYPPRRVVALASGLESLGSHAILRSTCEPYYRSAVEDVAREIASALR